MLSDRSQSPAGPQGRTDPRGCAMPAAVPANVAPVDPVARVALLLDPPHLNRPFDYWVPAELSDRAIPGVRVRVRFAGRLADGFLIERRSTSDHAGSLHTLHAVRDAVPVLTPQVRALVEAVANRYAGTFADVVKSAVPPRHRQAEIAVLAAASAIPEQPGERRGLPGATGESGTDVPPAWSVYSGAADFLKAATAGQAPRAAWVAGPGEHIPQRVSELVALQVHHGRGAIVVVPDLTDVARFASAFRMAGLEFERLTAAEGPQARYAAFMRVLTGQRRVVLGTRSAVFAPVVNLGLIVVWDDIDDSLAEPQAPGWHAREVAALRSGIDGCALVIGGASVSVETAYLISRDWLGVMALDRVRKRRVAAKVEVAGDVGSDSEQSARMPPAVVAAVRAALPLGPVVLCVRRTGYVPALSCRRCREQAICLQCGTGLQCSVSDAPAGVRLAGRCPRHGPQPGWSCPACGGTVLRAAAVGAARTLEEVGRAFPGARIIGSWAGSKVDTIVGMQAGGACLVVATSGCVPDPGPLGYQLAVILDGAAALSRPGLRTGEEVLAQWLTLASLVRPAEAGGRVLVVGPSVAREVQALIRFDPLGYARRELDERQRAALPPGVRVVAMTGGAHAVAEAVSELSGCFDAASQRSGDRSVLRISGPIPVFEGGAPTSRDSAESTSSAVRWVLTAPLARGPDLAAAVSVTQSSRSARRAPIVRHRMDPRSLL